MLKRSFILIIACIVGSALFFGCASIIHGTKQDITFQSSPAGASVSASTSLGVSFGSCETPCTLELKRKKEYNVTISKPGFTPVEMVIERKSDGWIWGNILLGGVIGLIVDFSNGAAYKLSPEEVVVTLSEESIGINPGSNDEVRIVFVDLEQLPALEREKVRYLNPVRLSSEKIIIE
ncbi:MAG: PEGA domain-containing protein [Candidatus Zixiibacteriota bacterium]|nr:MAG: PEGA domain-containing protein [candidate division Zixibacteria bacterium]